MKGGRRVLFGAEVTGFRDRKVTAPLKGGVRLVGVCDICCFRDRKVTAPLKVDLLPPEVADHGVSVTARSRPH